MSRAPAPHTYLTALSPIEHRADDPDRRLAGVRAALAAQSQYESALCNCPTVHMLRLQVIETLKPAMGDTGGVHLRSAWLLCVAELDGCVDDFVDALYRSDADFVHATWGRCTGYPPYRGAVFLRRYLARCRFGGELPYAAFAATVGQTRIAIERKEQLGAFVAAAQGLDPGALHAAFAAARDGLVRPNPPRAGSL